MLCQSCQKFDATVHQVQIQYSDQGIPRVHEEQLCPQCAQAKGLRIAGPPSPGFPEIVQKLSKSLLGAFPQGEVAASQETTSEACPECGWTERDFRQTSRLGCPHDYEFFSDFLEEVLERIHGYTEHSTADQEGRIEQLRSELDAAVLAEDYESAARLRDAIRALESDLENSDEPA